MSGWGQVPSEGDPPSTEQPSASPADSPAAPTAPDVPVPPVGWGAPPTHDTLSTFAPYAGGQPPFTVGALLSDTFARYGADPFRLLLLSAIVTVISYLSSYESFQSSPFFGGTLAPRGSGLAGLLGLLSLAVGVLGPGAMLALLDGGPSMPFTRIVRRAAARAGWMILATLLIGLVLVGIFVVAFIAVLLLAVINPAAGIIGFVAVFLAFLWLSVRLALTLPAVVVDDLNAVEALKLSWRVTKPAGVWARILAATFGIGLILTPAVLGSSLLLFAAIFGKMPALLVASAITATVVTPLALITVFSAYRRLVPPFAPSWTAQASGLGFSAPPLDAAAKMVLAAAIAVSVIGVAEVPYVADQFTSGRIAFPFPRIPGFPFPGGSSVGGKVLPGTIAFGTAGHLATCTVDGQLLFAKPGTGIAWMAALAQPVTPTDEVRLRVTRDGTEIVNELETPGSYDCIGVEQPSDPIESGVYTFEILVNGEPAAAGILFGR